MGWRTVDMHRLQELVHLHRKGLPVREIARLLGVSPNTERDYRSLLDKAGLLHGEGELPDVETLKRAVGKKVRAQERSTVEEWRDVIKERLDGGARPNAIHQWLESTDSTFTGSYHAVKRLCTRLRREQGPSADDVALHLDTTPGKAAQVDFGYLGLLEDSDGVMRKAYVFVMTLVHCRLSYFEIVTDQSAQTWQQLHINAFAYFGGVPDVIIPDNLKAAVVKAAFTSSETVELNQSYRELARHYGFHIDPTPPYAPQKKGKVESEVAYVKNNFFKTWRPRSVDEGNNQLRIWCREVAEKRIHGTTKRKPREMFESEEKAALHPLPSERFEPVVFRKAKVQRDAHVHVDGRLFSVPFKHIGQEALVEVRGTYVLIRVDDERVATHQRTGDKRHTLLEHLPKERRQFAERDPDVWLERAAAIGPNACKLVHDVLYPDDVLRQLRTAQATVLFLESVDDKARAEAACRRALYFGTTSKKTLKTILDKGLEKLPLEAPTHGVLERPSFARTSQ